MEIVNHRRKMLDAMESNAKGKDNFAIKIISMENVERKSYKSSDSWFLSGKSSLSLRHSTWNEGLQQRYIGFVHDCKL